MPGCRPTSASWLNQIERWFAEITNKRIRRGSYRSTRELEQGARPRLVQKPVASLRCPSTPALSLPVRPDSVTSWILPGIRMSMPELAQQGGQKHVGDLPIIERREGRPSSRVRGRGRGSCIGSVKIQWGGRRGKTKCQPWLTFCQPNMTCPRCLSGTRPPPEWHLADADRIS